MDTFDDILLATERPLRLFLASLGVPLADVDDLAQEVYLDFYQHQDDRPAGTEPIRWLKGMAKHKALDHFRRRKQRHRFFERLSTALERQQPRFGAGDDGLLDALEGCLTELPDDQRDLLARYYGEEPEDAVAARAPSAARMAVMRLREALRHCIVGRISGAES
jgi:DNA-directed RNA polymerase specialized sigma24 family protein